MSDLPRANLVTRTATATSVAGAAALAVSVTALSVSVALWAAAPLLHPREFRIAVVGGGAGVDERAPGVFAVHEYLEYRDEVTGELRSIADAAVLYDVKETADGALIMAGWATPVGAPVGSQDAFLIKSYGIAANKFGPDWFKFYGGEGYQIFSAVVERRDANGTAQGYFLAGKSITDADTNAWVIKTDLAGNLVDNFPKEIGVPDRAEEALAMTETVDANGVVNGYLLGGATEAPDGNRDAWWVMLDLEGNVLGNPKTHGMPERKERISAAVRMVNTSGRSEGFVLVGETIAPSNDQNPPLSDGLAIRLDNNGELGGWTENPRNYGGLVTDEYAYAVRQTFDRQQQPTGFILAGKQIDGFSNAQALLLKLTPLGDVEPGWNSWGASFGGAGPEEAQGVVQIFNESGQPNGYLLAGGAGPPTPGTQDNDVYLVRTDEAGQLLWSKAVGEQNTQIAHALIPLQSRYASHAMVGRSTALHIRGQRQTAQVILLPRNNSMLFRRGDANQDKIINLTDAVFTLNYLFIAGPKPDCLDAADANDDGQINLTDAVFLLNYLFLGSGLPPPDPGPDDQLGTDPSNDDELTCDFYPQE